MSLVPRTSHSPGFWLARDFQKAGKLSVQVVEVVCVCYLELCGYEVVVLSIYVTLHWSLQNMSDSTACLERLFVNGRFIIQLLL